MCNIIHEYNIQSAIHAGNLQINIHTGASSIRTAWSPQDRPALLRLWASPSLLSTRFSSPRLWFGKSGQRGLSRRQEVISTSQTIMRLISASPNPTLFSSRPLREAHSVFNQLNEGARRRGFPPPPGSRRTAQERITAHLREAGGQSAGAVRALSEGGRRGRAEVGWHLGPSH